MSVRSAAGKLVTSVTDVAGGSVSGAPLRIWHILESYYPEYGGGAAITTRDICRIQAAQGHEVRVLCTENSEGEDGRVRTDFDGPIRIDRINFPYFRSRDPDGNQLSFRQWRKHQQRCAEVVRQLLLEWTPDIADYHVCRPLGEACLETLQEFRVPMVATLHDAWLICPRLFLLQSPGRVPCPGPTPLRCFRCVYSEYDGELVALAKLPWRLIRLGPLPAWRLRRRAQARRQLDGAIARSRYIADAHRQHVGGLIRHLPLGIDLSVLPSTFPSRPRHPLRFGFVAGFQVHKGILHVLHAAELLRQEGLKFEIHVWGPDQEKGSQIVAERGLNDCVVLRGSYGAADLWQVYADLDVALMATTVCEPLGRVVQEAAAAGVPTVGPAVGGIREQIEDGVSGLLYRFGDATDLARQMRRLLTSPGLYQHLERNLTPPPHSQQAGLAVAEFYREVLSSLAARRA